MSVEIGNRPTHPVLDDGRSLPINRRTCFAIAGGLLAISGSKLEGVRQVAGEPFDIPYVLTDRRFRQSVEFGNALSTRGSQPFEVTAGLTAIWRQVLVPLWATPGGAVAGLTSREVWECVAEQARSHGRRSVLVGFHGSDPQSGAAGHWLQGPPQLLKSAAALEGSNEAWPLTMAALVTRCNKGALACAGEWRSSAALPNAPPASSLVSWIIG